MAPLRVGHRLSVFVCGWLCFVRPPEGVRRVARAGQIPAVQPGGKADRGNPPLFFSYQQFVGAPRSFWTPTVITGRKARASPRLALPAAMFEVAFAMPATALIAV